jgi:uncharacterized protein YecE (DUF72 family)
MTIWHLGTMGFAYDPWRGVFYPDDASPRSYLAYYSRVFNAVELDTTFYGTPRESTVRQWATLTPPDFQFCPKTPREITHELGLSLARGAGDTMVGFLEAVRAFGSRLGPVLIQLPPSFDTRELPVLAEFLAALPLDLRFAVEVRHPSWYETTKTGPFSEDRSGLRHILADLQMAWVALDYLTLPRQIVPTTGYLYIRWIGQHGHFVQRGREEIDVSARLAWWWDQIRRHAQQVPRIYGFFNDDYAGYAPATCNRFKALAGLAVVEPEIPQQETLF